MLAVSDTKVKKSIDNIWTEKAKDLYRLCVQCCGCRYIEYILYVSIV